MITRIKRQLLTLALASLVAAGSSIAASVNADEFDCGSDIVPVHPLVTVPGLAATPYSPDGLAPVQTLVASRSSSSPRCALQSTVRREMATTEELCGWVDLADVLPTPTTVAEDVAHQADSGQLGEMASDQVVDDFAEAFAASLAGGWATGCATHDSCPVDIHRMIAKAIEGQTVEPTKPVPQPAAPKSAAVADDESSLTPAAIATSIVTVGGVRIQQLIEPFAMVGPSIENSLASVRSLQSWYDGLVDSATSLRASDEAELQAGIAALAMEEPVDASAGTNPIAANPIEPKIESDDTPSVLVTKLDPLVGSSPIVMTIVVEEYLAYDLAPRDMMVWALPSMSRTFCVRQQLDQAAERAMWNDADAESMWQSTDELVQSSPECLLDDLLCRISEATHSVDSVAYAQPRRLGQSVAKLLKTSTRAAGDTVRSIAMRMPKEEGPADRPVIKRLAKENTCTMR